LESTTSNNPFLLYREASPKRQHSNPEPDKQLLRWLLALHVPSANNTPIYSPPSTLPAYPPGLTNGQAGKSEKNKIAGRVAGNYWRGRSGPCVGMGSRNFVYVVSGRAVRWGEPLVSRRGPPK
jgi:hypothetical protein